jgi:hypothetical protein
MTIRVQGPRPQGGFKVRARKELKLLFQAMGQFADVFII